MKYVHTHDYSFETSFFKQIFVSWRVLPFELSSHGGPIVGGSEDMLFWYYYAVGTHAH